MVSYLSFKTKFEFNVMLLINPWVLRIVLVDLFNDKQSGVFIRLTIIHKINEIRHIIFKQILSGPSFVVYLKKKFIKQLNRGIFAQENPSYDFGSENLRNRVIIKFIVKEGSSC